MVKAAISAKALTNGSVKYTTHKKVKTRGQSWRTALIAMKKKNSLYRKTKQENNTKGKV